MWHLRVSLIRLKVKYDCHVLQEGGELYFSDMYASKPVPDHMKQDPVLWGKKKNYNKIQTVKTW